MKAVAPPGPFARAELFSTWYRALKGGQVWCDSSDPDEVLTSGGDVFQKMETWQVTEGWKPWDGKVPSDS